METYEHRIINGIIKSDLAADPKEANLLLSRDIEIIVPEDRAQKDDLWPCIWALASVLLRQFSGSVFIRCGLNGPLDCPARLGNRCYFVSSPQGKTFRIFIGIKPDPDDYISLCGDARGSNISYKSLITGNKTASVISCFALAGYLGFAALASLAKAPPFRPDLSTGLLELPLKEERNLNLPPEGLAILGLGQLGQAYLGLLYFLALNRNERPKLMLLDKDTFEHLNYSTQVLLEDDYQWEGIEKAAMLAKKAASWGWEIDSEVTEITWVWRRQEGQPLIAMLGLDNLESRRMIAAAGFKWLVEAGLGDSFIVPRISWHSLPPSPELARKLFPSSPVENAIQPSKETEFSKSLKATAGGCGWLTFHNTLASAPCLGLVAAAYVWCEILRILDGDFSPILGRAGIWSPLLPFIREPIK